MKNDKDLLDKLDIYLEEIASIDPKMNGKKIGDLFRAYFWEYSTGNVRKDIENLINGEDFTNIPSWSLFVVSCASRE